MPYIPHTPKDTEEMLQSIGVDTIETLFDEIRIYFISYFNTNSTRTLS